MSNLPVKPPAGNMPRLIDANDEITQTPYNVAKDGVRQYGISPAEWIFVQEYVANRDHVSAYMKAYNVSRKSAYTSARKMLVRPEIQGIIYDLMAEMGRTMKAQREAMRAMLFQEALSPFNKGSERIKAIELMSKIDKFVDEKDKGKSGGTAPQVNVFIKEGNAAVQVNSGPEPVVVEAPQREAPPRVNVLIEADPVAKLEEDDIDL